MGEKNKNCFVFMIAERKGNTMRNLSACFMLVSLQLIGCNDFIQNKNVKIYVAGHNGLVGSAIVRKLTQDGYTNFVLRSSAQLDLRNQAAVEKFFEQEKPEYVFLAAAKVGGIGANSRYPADFIYDNLAIELNVIHAAYKYRVKKLLFLGSSCIYPRNCAQPIKEEYLLTSELEPTNDAYAIAKIAGIVMCRKYRTQYGANFISCMPTNLYGSHDNYSPENSHVLPAMLTKFVAAKDANLPAVTLWGSGTPYREFLHVDDCADACVFLMKHYESPNIINVGTGEDITIRDLALLIKNITGYRGNIVFDTSKPDGTPRKLLDVKKITQLGWKASFSLADGVNQSFDWYRQNYKKSVRA